MVSVIIRLDSIRRHYAGGPPGFFQTIPNRSLCCDLELARVGFMSLEAASEYVADLVEHGLQYHLGDVNSDASVPKRPFSDIVVVDQHKGPLAPCDWIVLGHMAFPQENYTAITCTLSPAARAAAGLRTTQRQAERLVVPEGWTVAEAKAIGFVDDQEWDVRYDCIDADDMMDSFQDKQNGQVVFTVPRKARIH
jgi:hypothetical protein